MKTNIETNVDFFLDALRCLIPKNEAYYLAVPITSGIRLWDLAASLRESSLDSIKAKFPTRYRAEVLLPNLEEASRRANRARKKFGRYVIDPSKFLRPDWQQTDYGAMWQKVIRQFAKGIILSSGWKYSQGCVAECIFGLKIKVSFFSMNGECLSLRKIYDDIGSAQEKARNMNLETCFLDNAHAMLSMQASRDWQS